MALDGVTIGLAVTLPLVSLAIGISALVLYRYKMNRRLQWVTGPRTRPGSSFQPTPGSDEREWARVSLQPLPATLAPASSAARAQSRFAQPQNTSQTVSFLRIGSQGEHDTRQRLHSVGSTLAAHTAHANPSSDALGHLRADRIGSLDDPSIFAEPLRNASVTLIGNAGRKSSESTMGSVETPSIRSSVVHRAQRGSVSVRKIPVGGTEEVAPVPVLTVGQSQRSDDHSPPHLDVRFAEPIAAGLRPPSRIDFTERRETPNEEKDSSLPYLLPSAWPPDQDPSHSQAAKRYSIEPALPSSKVCSPAAHPPALAHPSAFAIGDRRTDSHLDPIIDAPSFTAGRKSQTTDPSGQVTPDHARSGSASARKGSQKGKKKRRPDSIDLAIVRSPKLAAHHADHLDVPSASPPPLTAALNDLKAEIASSVMALKSSTSSHRFLQSAPATQGPKTVVPRTPRTPRTATSDGGHSIISDLESAQLFQAWRGFRAPSTPDLPDASIRRALSAPDQAHRRRMPKRSDTNDGELAVEVVGGSDSTPLPSAIQPRPIVTVDVADLEGNDKEARMTLKPGPRSLTPSPANSRSSSPQPKITYLAEVVKEEQRRLSVGSG